MSPDTLIHVHGATVSHGDRRILDAVDITIARRQIVTLVGPNGAGKSTLVKVALGLERLHGGHVHRLPNLKVGYQPQRVTLDHALPLSVRRFLTLTERHADAEVEKVLHDVGVPHLMNASVHALSGGEWQRTMIARAALRKPDLLVLDEPTQNVDASGAVEIYKIIARLRDETGCGVLLVSHDLNVVMAATDQVYCLNGHICCAGHPADVSRDAEFQRLFGPDAASLAIYSHHHDHEHGPDGKVTHGHHHHHHKH